MGIKNLLQWLVSGSDKNHVIITGNDKNHLKVTGSEKTEVIMTRYDTGLLNKTCHVT